MTVADCTARYTLHGTSSAGLCIQEIRPFMSSYPDLPMPSSSAAPPITAVGFYIDTLGIFLRRHPGTQSIRELKLHSGSATMPKPKERRDQRPRGWRVIVHQPQPEALRLLDELVATCRGCLNEVQVALDAVPLGHSFEETEAAAKWYGRRWHRKYSQNPRGTVHDEEAKRPCDFADWSIYSKDKTQRWGSENAVLYPRISALLELPCVHFEWRLRGRRTVARVLGGIIHAADLPDLDWPEFLRSRLTFAEVNYGKMLKMLLAAGPEHYLSWDRADPRQMYRLQHLLAYLAAIDATEPFLEGSITAIVAFCRKKGVLDLRPALRPVETPISHYTNTILSFPPHRRPVDGP